MLIYNFQKEFLGIDDKDLKILGFNTLSELRAEVSDFADLFVKTPGYIHNFKHVHWIDFINYADVSEESKVLINVNEKTFKANLSISTLFLIDNPNSAAYIIHLNNLRPLSKSENDNLSNDVLDRELPKVEPQKPKPFTAAKEPSTPTKVDAYDTVPHQQELQIDQEPTIAEPQIETTLVAAEEQTTPNVTEQEDIEQLSLDVFEEESTPEPINTTVAPEKKTLKKEIVQEKWDNGYVYDPHIASKELGLPLDLIEEFIQDFIAQAKEFKPDIYTSIEEGDVDNVKILSHKLKGVAANLRIEDAHEVLSTVSATHDMDVIHENLDTFYKIIAKLAGEPIEQTIFVEEEIQIEESDTDDDLLSIDFKELEESDDEQPLSIELDDDSTDEENEDELITLDFKDDFEEEPIEIEEEAVLTIHDEDVPDKIEMAELVDDDFLNITTEEDEVLVYSKSKSAQEIGLDEESFNELFEDFVAETHSIFTRMRSALEENNFDNVHKEALTLKGMSDNMRFTEFSNELETLINTTDKENVQEAIEKIETKLKKISEMGV